MNVFKAEFFKFTQIITVDPFYNEFLFHLIDIQIYLISYSLSLRNIFLSLKFGSSWIYKITYIVRAFWLVKNLWFILPIKPIESVVYYLNKSQFV